MPNFNKVFLMGHMTRDVETNYLPSQTPVANFGMATNRKWKDANGQDREEVLFVDCAAFGRQAEVLAQYTRKGSPLFIEGRLKLDQWEDKNGKRSKLSLVVESFQLMGRNEGAGDDKPQETPPPQRQTAPAPPPARRAPPATPPTTRTATSRPSASGQDPMMRNRQAASPIQEDADPVSKEALFKPDDIPF